MTGRTGTNSGAERTVTICNTRGLHARASAKFVAMAGQFDAKVTISHISETGEKQSVLGTSIMGLMMLAAAKGHDIDIQAEGQEAQQAVDALCELVESGFHES